MVTLRYQDVGNNRGGAVVIDGKAAATNCYDTLSDFVVVVIIFIEYLTFSYITIYLIKFCHILHNGSN